MIYAICLVTLVLLVLTAFMVFMLFWQRRKSNLFILEREMMKALYKEQLLKTQLEIQEQSFNAISMEIHDNVGQTLSLLKVQLNIIDQKEILDRVLLTDAKENVGKAMTDLRDIAKSLNSERIQQVSLIKMVEHELNRLNKAGNIQCKIWQEGEELNIGSEKKLILFRCIQESFQNIVKHSGASEVGVHFCYQPEVLTIIVADNGKGFEPECTAEKNQGLGLANIINRASMIGGQAVVSSITDQGTSVTISIPYD
jgi:signal transduction histidine kinase